MNGSVDFIRVAGGGRVKMIFFNPDFSQLWVLIIVICTCLIDKCVLFQLNRFTFRNKVKIMLTKKLIHNCVF